MIITTTEPCGCRGCGRVIGTNTRISWVDGEGPYHIECTHLVADALAEHNRITEPLAKEQPATVKNPDSLTYAAAALSCLMLLAALFGDFPYGYYQLLRSVTCSTLILLAFRIYLLKERHSHLGPWLAGGRIQPDQPSPLLT
jgi:hypothetical protein